MSERIIAFFIKNESQNRTNDSVTKWFAKQLEMTDSTRYYSTICNLIHPDLSSPITEIK